jgi:hypothetical protein
MLSGLHQEVRYVLITSLFSSANEQLFIFWYSLFNEDVSISDHTAPHNGDERSGRGLIRATIQNLAWRDRRKPWQTSINTVNALAEIRTENVLDVSHCLSRRSVNNVSVNHFGQLGKLLLVSTAQQILVSDPVWTSDHIFVTSQTSYFF